VRPTVEQPESVAAGPQADARDGLPETSASSGQRERSDPGVIIAPRHGWAPLDLRELLEHRELLYFLIWRNIKIRYKQTALGGAWAVLQPILIMAVFALIFGRYAGLPSDGSPYALFCLTALVPWLYFSNTLSQGSNSLIENERLITKVYFPRLLIPMSAVLAGLLDLLIAFVVLLVLLLAFGEVPTVEFAAVPLLMLLVTAAALAVTTLFAALNVYYRDIRFVTAFLVQFWLFITPVAYASSLVPDSVLPLYGLNPMVGVVDGFRWALLDSAPWPAITLPMSVVSVFILLLGAFYYFRRVEDSFADVV
jgi:lipopolysaccharide transport system permease protein